MSFTKVAIILIWATTFNTFAEGNLFRQNTSASLRDLSINISSKNDPSYTLEDVYALADENLVRFCQEIKDAATSLGLSTPSGMYQVDADGGLSGVSPTSAYCDMEQGWTMLYDFGIDSVEGYHKSTWTFVGSNFYKNHSNYPTGDNFTQFFSNRSATAHIWNYLPSTISAIKFVEVEARGFNEGNYANYFDKSSGVYRSVYSQSTGNGTSETIIDMKQADTTKKIYYHEGGSIVFIDSIWIK